MLRGMPRSDPRSLPTRAPRATKRASGTTLVARTPLDVRVGGVPVEPALKSRIPATLGRKLERFAPNITRVTVRFIDLNGPRGGRDTVCRVTMSMKGRDAVVVEVRDVDARTAFRLASSRAKTAVGRALDKSEARGQKRLVGRAQRSPRKGATARRTVGRPPAGSLIGRRVGRSRENLEAAQAWKGEGSTAARNAKLRTDGMSATLEDSARSRPSRKSTRKSANRAKSGAVLSRTKKQAHHAPKRRATRGS